MKHKALIYAIIIAIGVIGVTALIILGSVGGRNSTPPEPETTQDIEVNVQTPPVTDEPSVPPVTDAPTTPVDPPVTETPFDPDDPVGNGDIAPDEIPETDSKVQIVDNTVEDGQKDVPATPPAVTEDKVTTEHKKPTEEKPAEVENKIINDNELEKKEEAEKKKTEEDEKTDKPVTVISTNTEIGDEEDKPISFIDDTEQKSEDANTTGNGPVFVDPAQGGANPFEDGGDSEIDDHSSDEFIGEDGDRPGEGIHF